MFKKIPQLFRILHINFIIVKYGLDQVLLSIPLFSPIRFLMHVNPFMWFKRNHKSPGERIRLGLEELGPIFVKFGQTLSTRSDLIPKSIIKELSKLQDSVPPFPGTVAQSIVESELGDSIENLFETFNIEPKASASIAQVHEVTLKGPYQKGQRAIVKIIRPKIKKQIQRDIDLLYTLARLAEKYWKAAERLHPVEVVEEFHRILLDELDLMREAANASQLKRNFSKTDILYIPKIYWNYIANKVMVMEYVEGIPISDVATLKKEAINLKALAEQGVHIFFTQVFRDSFFHADMHPGNIFVNPDRKENPQYIAVDFGIVGTLNPEDQYYLASNMLAFFQRDYRKVAELHIKSGWVHQSTRMDSFESAIRTVCEPIFEKPLNEISFGKTLLRLFQIGRQFQMEVQPQLVLLQKTLLNVEGLGRQLYPQLDLWHCAKPFFENWMKQQIGPRAVIKKIMAQQLDWTQQFPQLPELVYNALKHLEYQQKRFEFTNKEKKSRQRREPQKPWRYFFLGIITTCAIGAWSFFTWQHFI